MDVHEERRLTRDIANRHKIQCNLSERKVFMTMSFLDNLNRSLTLETIKYVWQEIQQKVMVGWASSLIIFKKVMVTVRVRRWELNGHLLC